MRLQLIRHLWGVTDPWEECIPRFARDGYEGIESVLPEPADEARFTGLLADHDLVLIPQLLLPGRGVASTVAEQTEHLRRLVDRAVGFDPILLNCHGGYDGWSLAEAVDFYGRCLEIEADAGVPIAHETHRGRYFHSPWHTRDVLQQLPQLNLCVDFSHWVCVCERLIDDLDDIIALAATRALHVHARVGYAEGPQVSDPRADVYRDALQAHQRWWDRVWAAQAKRGLDVSTLTPEFGPPPYLQTDPTDGRPLADLEAVCNWMARLQAERFAAAFAPDGV